MPSPASQVQEGLQAQVYPNGKFQEMFLLSGEVFIVAIHSQPKEGHAGGYSSSSGMLARFCALAAPELPA